MLEIAVRVCVCVLHWAFLCPRSVSALHCNVVKEGDPRELVAANRAITFGSAVRRKPNAFTLVHQMKMVAAHGVDDMEAFGEGFVATQSFLTTQIRVLDNHWLVIGIAHSCCIAFCFIS